MLMAHWRDYLGVMNCRDGKRMYLFAYGEWNSKINWTKVELTENGPGKKKHAGGS